MNMNNKKLFILLLIIVIGVVGYLLFSNKSPKQSVTDNSAQENSSVESTTDNTAKEDIEKTFTFTSPTSKESVAMTFSADGETATLNGLGYESISLDVATSGSGARYVNAAEQLEVWNRGEEVTISRAEKEIFTGNVGGLTDIDRLTASKWVWQATTIKDAVIEPKAKDAFVISFDTKEGTINVATDCNAIFGPYTVEGEDKLKFGALGMTKKFCDGSQDSIFAEQLSEVSSFYFTGSGALAFQFGSSADHMLFGKQ